MKELVTCEWCSGSNRANPETKICQSCYLAKKKFLLVKEYVKRIFQEEDDIFDTNYLIALSLFKRDDIGDPLEYIKNSYKHHKENL